MNELNLKIEQTLLKPVAEYKEIERFLQEAVEQGFYGVCLPPFWVRKAWRDIRNTPLKLITVVGFPFGYQMSETKLDEIKRAIDNGADELDVVMNISAFKSGMEWTKIDIAKCANLCHQHEKIIKVIIETALLKEHEVQEACKICAHAGADFVKTSTGYASQGATPEVVKLMRASLPASVEIKASGGIKTYAQALELIEAGAGRIGTSSGRQIMEEAARTGR